MKFALYIPIAREFADVRVLGELAQTAEASGWDGIFLWDELNLSLDPGQTWPIVDPWIALSAIAASTSRIRFGTMVTPIARRRPWKLARETVTLDHLSAGRLTLGVGLGGPSDTEFARFGEAGDLKTLAGKLDEGLEVLNGLWSGDSFSFQGRYYRVENAHFLPTPVQRPRIPVWVGCLWPRMGPLRRSVRWDGLFPIHKNWPVDHLLPEDYREVSALLGDLRRGGAPFDLAATSTWQGERPGLTRDVIGEYEAAGATWWLQEADSLENARRYASISPPR